MTTSGNMPPPDPHDSGESPQWALPVSQKVVLVIDLVESVRLMAADEAGTVARWHSFAHAAQQRTILAHHGRLVKSLGDGLMVEFESPRDAANAAQAMHGDIAKANSGLPAEQHMHLRAGINATHVYTDSNDIFGAGVNLAARIATLAGPGETVVTAPVRDGLTDGLDATIEDLGECYLKHIEQPVRAYRVGAAGQAPVVVAQREYATPLQPTIAVIPFSSRSNEPEHFAIGELIADGVIGQLSRSAELRVISRLSTTVFRNREQGIVDIQAHLGANFVVSGSYIANGDKLLVMAELSDTHSHEILWTLRLNADVGDLLDVQSNLIHSLAGGVCESILNQAALQTRQQPWPTLPGFSLMLGGITLTHRISHQDFFKARDIFTHLAERHQRIAALPAWLAKWHVLEAAQGWSSNASVTAQQALMHSSKALDLDPESPLALSIDGFVRSDMLRDFDGAMHRYETAIARSPSESMAWLFKGLLHGFRGEPLLATQAIDKALVLSPVDPAKYFFESLAASAYLSAGSYGRAIELARRSLRANATHVSTYRALVIAQAIHGDEEGARASARQMIKLDPAFTVQKFLARRSGGGFDSMSKTFADALRLAGVPN